MRIAPNFIFFNLKSVNERKKNVNLTWQVGGKRFLQNKCNFYKVHKTTFLHEDCNFYSLKLCITIHKSSLQRLHDELIKYTQNQVKHLTTQKEGILTMFQYGPKFHIIFCEKHVDKVLYPL